MKHVLKNPVAAAALVVILVAEEAFLADEVAGEAVETTSWLRATSLRLTELISMGSTLERKGRCRNKRYEQKRP